MNGFFLKLNSSKTKIIMAPPSVRIEIIINGTFIKGKCVRFVDCAKNLGVLLDAVSSFNIQINKVIPHFSLPYVHYQKRPCHA